MFDDLYSNKIFGFTIFEFTNETIILCNLERYTNFISTENVK